MDQFMLVAQLNKETKMHSIRVSKYAKCVAKELGLNEEFAEKCGYLHDVGKLYIPSRILLKTGRLNPLEREIIDTHSYLGYKELLSRGYDEDLCKVVLYHHGERKVAQSNIPALDESTRIYAKLIQTVDCFDAITSERSYHSPMSYERAIKFMLECEEFDKNVLLVLEKLYVLKQKVC